MGKELNWGANLRYPIIVNKFLKKPGDKFKKQDSLLEYKFKWMKMVGDPLGEQWEEEQTTYARWDSPAEGTISSWLVKEGMTVAKDGPVVEVEEDCPHSIQYAGLCGICGKDMTEVSYASGTVDADRARINMIHDQTHLTVSREMALEAEEELQRRLLKNRKLSLVVDLDQTIIHACIEPTVGEWQRDVNSPNYEAVKDVRSFQLKDDNVRGLASGCWYYIKMRPGLTQFLEKVSEMYELHVYTMGTRAYAINIAKIVDPNKKLFGDRIISRDENGNVTAKSLARLFPQSTHMVAIIDDRADVWPMNRPNLIKVVPYDFFLGIGDINSSFLPKREELPKAPTPKKKHAPKPENGAAEATETVETPSGEIPKDSVADDKGSTSVDEKEDSKNDATIRVSAVGELARIGGANDEAVLQEQTAEQEKFLEKQLMERPLLHMQEQLDKQEEEEEETTEETPNGTVDHQHQHHHKHNLLKDDDVELTYLEQHLKDLHKAFYEEYDKTRINVPGGRVAQLKPGRHRKISVKDEAVDLKDVPNIAVVMPRLKSKVLEGCVIVMSGLVPLGVDLMRSEIAQQTESFGAQIRAKVSKKVTHVVASSARTRTQKVRQAAKYPHIKIVTQQWLLQSMSKWKKEDETPYLVDIDARDRRPDGDNANVSSMEDTEDSEDYTGSEGDDDEDNRPSNSQEIEIDDDGVIPDDMDPGRSPVEELNQIDWEGVDDELAEFMGDEDESGTESDTSMASNTSRGSRVSQFRGHKRPYEENTEDEESDPESALVKKQRIAKERTTSLKTVKTPTSASESSLPTPGVTGDENEDVDLVAAEETDQSLDDFEAEMEAAFEEEEAALASPNA